MPITFSVPETVQRAAKRGLDAHADPEWKLKDVAGISTAEALSSGHVTIDTVAKMRRFFAVNATPYLEEVRSLRTLRDSATVRSWHLHGAESGRAWADRRFKEAVQQGLLPADPVTELMSLRPDGVYNRFALGSWRYEYDLNPRKAARFVENYMRATGWPLDLRQAFGQSAEAVGNAIYRRYHTPNPFRVLYRAMMAEDVEYRIAATRDLDFLKRNLPPDDRLVLETFKKHIFTSMNPKQAAKLVWAPFVAYFILSVEAPKIVDEYNEMSVKPPKFGQKVKSFMLYNDTVNTCIAYFHPDGARYVDAEDDPKFDGVDTDMMEMVWNAYYSRKMVSSLVKKHLGRARRWTAKNKLAGNLFHIFIADWKKGNWQHILDNIPTDADVRPYFEQFVKGNPVPAEGVKLQQSLSKKSEKTKIEAYYAGKKWGPPKAVQAKLTDAAFEALAKKTPLGIYSVMEFQGEDYVYMGAWKVPSGTLKHIFQHAEDGTLHWQDDVGLASGLKSGKAIVKQAHKDMPGTAYGQSATEPEKVQEPPNSIQDDIDALLVDDFPNHYTEFKEVEFSTTESSAAALKRFGGVLTAGTSLVDKNSEEFMFLAVYMTPEGPILILRNPDGELIWQDDGDFSEIIATGNVKMKGWKDPNVLNIAAQAADPEMAGTPTAAEEGPPPAKFGSGEIIDYGGLGYYMVLASDGDMYLLLRLTATALGSVLETRPKLQVDGTAKWIATHVDGKATGENYVRIPNHEAAEPIDMPAGFSPGDSVVLGDDEFVLVQAFSTEDGEVVLAYASDSIDWQGHSVIYPNYRVLDFASVGEPVESSYEPTEPRPEPGAEDAMDQADPDTGNTDKSGTPEAIEYVQKKGWSPAVKANSPGFEFELGAKVAYGHAKSRTIIGYAIVPEKLPPYVYITMTEKGNISFKTIKAGNKAYGPVIEIMQDVVDVLVPVPSETEPKFPKLNYALSKTAKKMAKEASLIYIPAPDNAPFYVGTKLIYLPAGEKLRLIGWIAQTKGGEPTGVPEAILWHPEDEVIWPPIEAEDLKDNYTVAYKHTVDMNAVTGEMVFGKMPGPKLTVKAPWGVSIGDSPLPDGWDDPDPIEQPPMSHLPTGKHVSAGIIAVMPPLSMMSDGDTIEPSPSTLFLMTHPLNDFAGYTLTYPKGTVDKGESLEHTAVREVYEETGLSVKPVGYLGDFKGRDSITRFFMGYITGGTPADAGKETDAVVFKPVPIEYQKQPWYSELKSRDKMVTDAAVKWLLDNGWPHLFTGEKADAHSQVTGPQDVEGQTGVVAFNPNAKYSNASATMKQASSITDYKVSSAVKSWAAGMNAPMHAMKTWSWGAALPMLGRGYPPPGVKVTLDNEEGEWTVAGYVHMENSTGNFITDVILEKDGGFIGRTIYIQDTADGAKDYLLASSAFHPAVSPVVAKKQTIPADTSKEDVWRTLLFKCPYPVNEEMIAALKGLALEAGFVPAVFNCARQSPSMPEPTFGRVFMSDNNPLVCLGYVTIIDTDKVEHRLMFAQNQQGQYVTLSATPAQMGSYLPLAGDEGFGNPDPWFTHPTPKTNKLIQQVYANGGNVKAVGATMSTFTTKWMKAAKFPAWAVITKIVVQDVASLFVPGAATKPVYDAVIGMLKARMKATHKGKGKVTKKTKTPVGAGPSATGMSQPTFAAIPAWKPAMPPPKKIGKAKLAYNSPIILQQVDDPEPGLFKDTGHTVSGGSNPCKVLTSPGGFQWFFKIPKDKAKVRIHAEIAAFKFAQLVDKPTAVPVGEMEFGGQSGSFQPLLDGGPPEADPGDLPDEDKGEVLAQHMLDMFMGDHDGHRGNWMRLKAGKLVPIDRGQAFKFVLKGLTESLDPHWHPKGNVGEGYAKKLLKDWGTSDTEIPEIAWKVAREMLEKISKISKEQIQNLLAPVLDASNITAGKRLKIITTLDKRRGNYLKDWTKVLKKLRKSFKWPKIGKVKLSVQAPKLRTDPKELGFGTQQAKEIATAAAYPTRGRAMKVDRDAIEQQEVMVKSVLWEKAPGKKVPATLIHFRVARPAGLLATKKMLSQSGGVKDTPDAGGPHRLAVDTQNGFWDKIESAIKTLNYHLAPPELGGMPDGADGKPNQQTLSACFQLEPDLKSVIAATKKTAGTYGPMDEPNTVVNSMAGMYLEYITDHIKPIADDLAGHKGKHTPQLHPFLWEEPTEEPDEEPEVKPPFTVQANSGAKWPKIVQGPDGLTVQHLNHDAYSGSAQNQFVIRDDHTKATLFINPPGPVPGAPGLKTGVEGHKGQSWGLIEGVASSATVAHLFKLFEQASGITMKPATKKDNEVLFWSRQAYVTQGKGKVQPKSDGTGIVTAPYAAAMALYHKGKDEEALAALQKITADSLGMSVTKAKAAAKPLIDGRFEEAGGVGFMRHERLGWDRDKLIGLFGKNWYVGHHLNVAMGGFIQALGDVPILMAHNVRAFWGAPSTGASVGSDYDSGGTQGVFMGFRRGSTGQSNTLYFDIELMKRTDLAVIALGDGYGKVTHPRFTTPERWAADTFQSHNTSRYKGSLGASSQYQVTARHGVNLLDYLHTAVCSNESERAKIIDLCKQRGWNKFGPLNRSPEKVFVVSGKEKL